MLYKPVLVLPPIAPAHRHVNLGHSKDRSRSNRRNIIVGGYFPPLSIAPLVQHRSTRSHTDCPVRQCNRARRRVRSLGQSGKRTRFDRSTQFRTPSRANSMEMTYVLDTGTKRTANGERGENDLLKTPILAEQRETVNEGVVRKSQYVKSIADDRSVRKKYNLDEAIGEGNFSLVVRCYDRKDGTKWALKAVSKACLDKKIYYIENEVDLLTRFAHQNIIKLKEAYETVIEYYLIMEYAENGDLFDAVKTAGSFDECTTGGIVRDVASALNYLHMRRVVHRDVKPENVLLTIDFRVKLGDFGLACQVHGPLYRVCGTPTYVAPEVLAETGYGLAVDCWSLGVITYILLCGYAPFRHVDRNELFHSIQRGWYQFDGPKWIRVSKGAKDLIASLLTIDQRDRCQIRHVLRNQWLRKMMMERSIRSIR